MPGPLGSDTNSPMPDGGTSPITLHLAPVPLGIDMSLGRLIPDWEAKRAFTQFNLHSVDTAKLKLIVKNLAREFGGQDRIGTQFHYLEGELGARLLRAFYKTAAMVDIDPAFLMAVAFAEGLNKFIDRKLRWNSRARPDNFNDMGMDRFLKEKYRLGTHLPEDLEYSRQSAIANEKDETVGVVLFGSVEDAIAVLGAMIVDRRAAVERDLYAFGLDPASAAEDDLLYWTYVYYNAGSGPPSDPKGTGRQHLAQAAQSANGLAIPKTIFQGPGEIVKALGNAQRVIGMTLVLRGVGVQKN